MLGLEDEHLRVAGQAAREQVEGVGAVAGEDDLVALARSHERPHLGPGLLVPGGGHARGPAVAAVDRGVGPQRGVDGLLDADQCGGRGGVVEVGVVDGAVQGRHRQRLGHDRGERERRPRPSDGVGSDLESGTGRRWLWVRACATGRVRRKAGGGVLAIDMGAAPGPWDPGAGSRSALADCRSQTARSSPGAPHRGGGLLVSKPGLRADTHDLWSRVGPSPPVIQSVDAGSRHLRRQSRPARLSTWWAGSPVVTGVMGCAAGAVWRWAADGRPAHRPPDARLRRRPSLVVSATQGPASHSASALVRATCLDCPIGERNSAVRTISNGPVRGRCARTGPWCAAVTRTSPVTPATPRHRG